jgi:hypothetical protein
VGIVDCTPRFASRLELDVLRSVGQLGNAIVKAANRPAVRRLRGVTYVSLREFKAHAQTLSADGCGIALEIAPASPVYEALVPGITRNVARYNSILHEVFGERIVGLSDIEPADLVMSDHHHLSPNGHRIVAERVVAKLTQLA